MVVEDAHWADPSTRELIRLCGARASERRLLLLLTSRPEGAPRMGAVDVVEPGPLAPAEARRLARAVAGRRRLPAGLLDDAVARADGVPLFVAELIRAAVEPGVPAPAGARPGPVPPSLHDGLLARLDRLGPAKATAQVAACVGREFTPELLSLARNVEPETLQVDLDAMAEAGWIDAASAGRGGRLRFTHALMRDAAHGTLTRPDRRRIHTALLDALDPARTPPEALAHHAAQAGRPAEAARWSGLAGRAALARASLHEAAALLEAALAEIRTLPDGPRWAADEVWTLLRLAHAYNGIEGSAGARTAARFREAAHLAERMDPEGAAFPARYGAIVAGYVRGELSRARLEAEGMLSRAGARTAPEHRMMAAGALATVALLQGRLKAGEDAFAEAHRLEGRVDGAALLSSYGHDPRGVLRGYRALGLLRLGRREEAFATWREGREIAAAASHAQSLAQPLVFGALLHLLDGDGEGARPLVAEALELAEEFDLVMWRAYAVCLDGWARHLAGSPRAAASRLRRGLAALDAQGARYLGPRLRLAAAEVARARGDEEAALASLRSARAAQEATGERWAALDDTLA